jgi:hypothetical protein
LEERTAVVFGKATSCATPVVITINDHARVVEALRLDELQTHGLNHRLSSPDLVDQQSGDSPKTGDHASPDKDDAPADGYWDS